MTKIVLVRHGQTVWNKIGRYQGQTDIDLSELGVEQAKCLGENFPEEHISGVYASSLQRAVDTGKAVADHFGLSVVPCDEFREIHFGEWEGLTYEEIHEKWPVEHDQLFDSPDICNCPSGESFAQVQKRAVAKMEELLKLHKDETIVIAAHGGVNRTLLCHVLGMPLKNMWRIRQDNTAVNVISFYDNGKINVDLVNSTQHLSHDKKLENAGVFGYSK